MRKKNKQKPANDAAAEKPSFERRSLRFVLKLIGYMFLFFYLAWAVPHTRTWAEILQVQRQPVEKLAEITPDYLYARRPDKIYTWIKMRKGTDIDKIMEILEPYTGELSSLTFTVYADRLAARGDIQDAVFWHQFSLYRLRFDALRCGQDEEAIGVTEAMTKVYRNRQIIEAIERDPAQLPRTIRAVLDMDAKYPARNAPVMVCDIVRGLTGSVIHPMPEQDWAWMRHMLRNKSEADLALLEAGLQKAKQESLMPPETENETDETRDADGDSDTVATPKTDETPEASETP